MLSFLSDVVLRQSVPAPGPTEGLSSVQNNELGARYSHEGEQSLAAVGAKRSAGRHANIEPMHTHDLARINNVGSLSLSCASSSVATTFWACVLNCPSRLSTSRTCITHMS